jgi:hypothetical protein
MFLKRVLYVRQTSLCILLNIYTNLKKWLHSGNWLIESPENSRSGAEFNGEECPERTNQLQA